MRPYIDIADKAKKKGYELVQQVVITYYLVRNIAHIICKCLIISTICGPGGNFVNTFTESEITDIGRL